MKVATLVVWAMIISHIRYNAIHDGCVFLNHKCDYFLLLFTAQHRVSYGNVFQCL